MSTRFFYLVGKVFDKHNFTWFLCGGEEITVIRDNGEIIPYDIDSDITVDVGDDEKVDKIVGSYELALSQRTWNCILSCGRWPP